ncbi:MAG: lipoyl synthase, partial [Muribaculaceae bacterium]|nr:lipoyl synthase [Muribaculaceae bacterium]
KYESHHNVNYTPEALEACVKLTDRYLSDRNFPDKAIDALDEAGSRAHITNINVPEDIEKLEEEVRDIEAEKQKAVREQNFENAASLYNKEKDLKTKLQDEKEKWEEQLSKMRVPVDEDKVAEVVAMMTGVPVQRIAKAEGSRLREMTPVLQSQIIGQDNAIEKIVKAIQRNRVGLKDPNKPIGTFMFLGPTGVGKTHLAKKLSEYLFDSTDALIRIDMSEYMEKFTVSRLVGAPPGYVGYEEGGQLTEKVRRRPYSVVLLDEIEKAHPDVFNLLLQVMDEGRLTDSLGRRIDFKNTLIIMTSNIGTRQLKDFGSGVGFATPSAADKEFSHGVLQKALNKAFAPEFLNRIDETVMFTPLDKKEITDIVESVKSLKLNHIVITSVDRDDLPDLGAGHWANMIRTLKKECPEVTMEVLIPDFQGREELVKMVIDEKPDVISHNLETVRRLTPDVRCHATYDTSLKVIRMIAESRIRSKSGIMLGLGETPEEIEETMRDLLAAGCEVMTIGQYLQPTAKHYPVRDYI